PRWDEKGNVVRALPEAAAAPATVSGELHSISHWSLRMLWEGGGKQRPASQETCRRCQPQPRLRVEVGRFPADASGRRKRRAFPGWRCFPNSGRETGGKRAARAAGPINLAASRVSLAPPRSARGRARLWLAGDEKAPSGQVRTI